MATEDEDNVFYTDGMKDKTYRKQLVPLKLKISQILLYDTESALLFLQEYNEIVKNGFESDIFIRINDLELKLKDYEKSEGKEKMYDEQSSTIIQQIEDLQIHHKQLPLEEFEQQLKEINNVYYNNSINYSFEKKEAIESQINSLQANLIMQKANIATTYDMKEMITENNKEGLIMYVYSELSKLMQSENRAVQKIANQLKTMSANGEDFIYDTRTWKLLDSAQRNIITKNEEQAETRVNLPAVQKKKTNFSFLDKIFGTKIKIGDKEMKVKKTIQLGMDEIKTKDLSKIDLNWLASNVSKQMLEEIEKKRLDEEGRNSVEKYVPDEKTPIYDFVENSKNFEYRDKSHFRSQKIKFFNQEGTEVYMNIDSRLGYIDVCGLDGTNLPTIRLFREDICCVIKKTIKYAEFIDNIIGSNLKQELANEIGVVLEKISVSEINQDFYVKAGEMLEIMNKLPIYNSLLKSYQNVETECKETKLNFRGQEHSKRENFYKQSDFKNNLVSNNKTIENGEQPVNQSENPINREEDPSNRGGKEI